MPELILEKRLFDYLGLGIKGLPERWLAYPKDIGLMLALLQGMGPDGAKLVNVDANGNLLISSVASSPAFVRLLDASLNANVFLVNQADALGPGFAALLVASQPWLFNGAAWDKQRSASAANLAAQSGLGAALTATPGEWAINANPAVGLQAIATRAAGAAGVRHICRSLSFGFSSQAALAGVTTVTFQLTDGGVTIEAWTFDLPAAIIAPFAITLSPLHYVGGAAQAMTMQTDAAHAGLRVFTNISGYDAS